MKFLVMVCLFFAISVSFASSDEGTTADNSMPCGSSSGCKENETTNDCRDILDDPNSLTTSEVGEAPTGY